MFSGCEDPPAPGASVPDACLMDCDLGTLGSEDGAIGQDTGTIDPDAASPSVDAAAADMAPPPECMPGARAPCDDTVCLHDERVCDDAGRWGPCAALADEICNGQDDDCDGRSDEGFNTGAPCPMGVGACAVEGRISCSRDGGAYCDGELGLPEDEACNGVDDDCDGFADEAFALGMACEVGVGACVQGGVFVCGEGGAQVCDAQAGDPVDELCNGQDDDCDGIADEGDPQTGDACDTGRPGVCGPGIGTCVRGVIECRANEVPQLDRCDGLDNDCDGHADEDGQPIGTACRTGGFGLCGAGVWRCDAAGGWTCQGEHEPQDEICDGVDNDCDGLSDERFPERGQECDTGGLGACVLGRQACVEGGLVCEAVLSPGDEVCNDADDDCDGFVDEGLPLEVTACETGGVGACNVGALRCAQGAYVCVPNAPPRAERCDGRDDDCDGVVDEAFPTLGDDCAVGVGRCERAGRVGCGEDGLSSTCGVMPGAPVEETCNGQDDDCNGVVDDVQAPPSTPDHCGACGVTCAFPHGNAGCDDGVCVLADCQPGWFDQDGRAENGCEWSCAPSDPPEEVCDGLDNDCNGRVDGPDVCRGDAFGYCDARRRLKLGDFSCDVFDAESFAREYWIGSLISAGGAEPDVSENRGYAHAGPRDEGGGHTRRFFREGPGIAVTMNLHYRGRFAVGVFDRDTRTDPGLEPEPNDFGEFDEVEPPELAEGADRVGPVGEGYVLWFEPDDAGRVQAVVRRSPSQRVLWRAPALGLDDGELHAVYWLRRHQGDWWVEIDGIPLTPDEEAPADQEVSRFDRLSLWVDPGPGPSSRLDAIAVQGDVDADGFYRPRDNCPYVFNPAQLDPDRDGQGLACDDPDGDGVETGADLCAGAPDPDQADRDLNGRGDACDFDAQLLFSAGFGGVLAPWAYDLRRAVHDRLAAPPTNIDDAALARDGRVAWSVNGEVFVADPEGEVVSWTGSRAAPDFVGDGLVYHTIERDRVVYGWWQEGVLEERVLARAAAPVRLHAFATGDAREVVIVRAGVDVVTVERVTLEGEALTPALIVSEAHDGAGPNIARHPSADLFVVAQFAGANPGVRIIDPSTGAGTHVSDRPSHSAVFTPDGAGVVALESSGAARQLVLYPRPGVEERVELMAPTSLLGTHRLSWGRARLGEDHDGDGRVDAVDRCNGYPVPVYAPPIVAQPGEGRVRQHRLRWLGDTYAVRWSRGVMRLEADGVISARRESPRTHFGTRCLADLAFRGGHYEIVRHHTDEDFEGHFAVSTMTPDWRELEAEVDYLDGDCWGLEVGAQPAALHVYSQVEEQFRITHLGDPNSVEFESTPVRIGGAFPVTAPPVVSDGRGGVFFGSHNTEPGGWGTYRAAYVGRIGPGGALIDFVLAVDSIGDRIDFASQSGGIDFNGRHIFYVSRSIMGLRGRRLTGALDYAGEEVDISGRVVDPGIPDIASDGEGFVVVFDGNVPGGGRGVYARTIDRDGRASDAPVLLSAPEEEAMKPAIAWDGHAYSVIWTDPQGTLFFTRERLDCR